MQLQENLTASEITALKSLTEKYFLQQGLNCGITMMHCLSDFFKVSVHPQVYASINGIMEHRDKRHQCGLYKGALMFLGIYGTENGWDRTKINTVTLSLAHAFEEYYSSLHCYDIRPDSFSNNPDHNLCHNLAADAVLFAAGFIKRLSLE